MHKMGHVLPPSRLSSHRSPWEQPFAKPHSWSSPTPALVVPLPCLLWAARLREATFSGPELPCGLSRQGVRSFGLTFPAVRERGLGKMEQRQSCRKEQGPQA